MPALAIASELTSTNLLAYRDAAATALAANGTAGDPLFVVCAWPVSGQYGPGSRFLYYALVVACVVAQKVEWLKKACLAAALLLPAVAALHGVVLAALHVDGAVDLDLYGAFQLCAIGILAAPVTVKLSPTYFHDRGRSLIFGWTGLILAGLLSLTVEFYRSSPVPCQGPDSDGNPVPSDPAKFPYDTNTTCGLACQVGPGNPYSPMRDWNGSTNNIYVIPAPDVMTFDTATLLSAACCIPALLSLASMWNKIAEFNWTKRFGHRETEAPDGEIEGTNGATPSQMRRANEEIKKNLKMAVEIPVFGAAVLAVLGIGEKNLFSTPLKYQTEPMASVGQWGSIVGSGLAALGSLYIVLARRREGDDDGQPLQECKCHHHHHDGSRGRSPSLLQRPTLTRRHSIDGYSRAPIHETVTGLSRRTDAGNRRKFSAALSKMSDYIGTPSRKRFDVTEFNEGAARNYPQIPGEETRNSELNEINRRWPTPSIREQPSRSGSPDSTFEREPASSEAGGEPLGSPPSPHSPSSPSLPTMPRGTARSTTFPKRRASAARADSSSSAIPQRRRRDTLEVPSPAQLSALRNNSTINSASAVALPAGHASPAIVVSAESDNIPQISESPAPLSSTSSPLSSPGVETPPTPRI